MFCVCVSDDAEIGTNEPDMIWYQDYLHILAHPQRMNYEFVRDGSSIIHGMRLGVYLNHPIFAENWDMIHVEFVSACGWTELELDQENGRRLEAHRCVSVNEICEMGV